MVFGLLGLIALPYTPASSGWQGLVGNGLFVWNVIGIITHALLVLGFLRFIKSTEGSSIGLKSRSKISYPIGLIFIIQTQIGLGLVGWPGSVTGEHWWVGVVSLAFTGLMLLAYWLLPKLRRNLSLAGRMNANRKLDILSQRLNIAGSFEWAIKPLNFIYQAVGQLTRGLAGFLEGEAGIIWALIFVILIISFIRIGGQP